MQAVIGSRTIHEFDFSTLELTHVVSGGADGIDKAVKRYCEKRGIPIKEILPDYAKHGRKLAPLVRNKEIVNSVTKVFAIWDGKSRGTMHAVRYARSKNIPVVLITV